MEKSKPQVTLSAAVMAHPSRRESAQKISAALGGAPIMMDDPSGPQSSLRTSLLAWRAAPQHATHHLVLQDDVIVSPQLVERITAGATLFPNTALAFYANAHHRNGAAMRLAAAAGASWVGAIPETYFPTAALVLPTSCIAEYVRFASRFTDLWEADDRALARFLHASSTPAVLSVPCFVDHLGLPSISNAKPLGMLKAACSPPSEPGEFHDAISDDFEYCPDLFEGQLQLLARVRAGRSTGFVKADWATQLSLLGLDEAEKAFLATLSGNLSQLSGALNSQYLRGIWDTAWALGALVARGYVPVKTLRGEASNTQLQAVRRSGFTTLALAGNRGTSVTPATLQDHREPLIELLENAFTAALNRSK